MRFLVPVCRRGSVPLPGEKPPAEVPAGREGWQERLDGRRAAAPARCGRAAACSPQLAVLALPVLTHLLHGVNPLGV